MPPPRDVEEDVENFRDEAADEKEKLGKNNYPDPQTQIPRSPEVVPNTDSPQTLFGVHAQVSWTHAGSDRIVVLV